MATPTVKFLTSPEIIFEGSDAYCAIEIDTGGDYTIDMALSTFEAYDGIDWVKEFLLLQIGTNTKRAIIHWKMQAETDTKFVALIVNSNGETSGWVETASCSYPPVGVDLTVVAAGILLVASAAIVIDKIT